MGYDESVDTQLRSRWGRRQYFDYPLTRLEMTLDPSMPYERANFPTVYYLDDLQMCFEETKATETERFIIDALFQGCGTIDQFVAEIKEVQRVAPSDTAIDGLQTVIPDFVIDTMARAILPSLQDFYASPEGQAAFEEWKRQQEKNT